MRKFRIEGQIYVAKSWQEAYSEHMRGWQAVPIESTALPPLVPILQEFPIRELSSLEVGKLIHARAEKYFQGSEINVDLRHSFSPIAEFKTAGVQTGRIDSRHPNRSNAPRSEFDYAKWERRLLRQGQAAKDVVFGPQVTQQLLYREILQELWEGSLASLVQAAREGKGYIRVKTHEDGSFSYEPAPEPEGEECSEPGCPREWQWECDEGTFCAQHAFERLSHQFQMSSLGVVVVGHSDLEPVPTDEQEAAIERLTAVQTAEPGEATQRAMEELQTYHHDGSPCEECGLSMAEGTDGMGFCPRCKSPRPMQRKITGDGKLKYRDDDGQPFVEVEDGSPEQQIDLLVKEVAGANEEIRELEEKLKAANSKLRDFYQSWEDVWFMLTGEDNRCVYHRPGVQELWRRLSGAGHRFGKCVVVNADVTFHTPMAVENPEAYGEPDKEGDTSC